MKLLRLFAIGLCGAACLFLVGVFVMPYVALTIWLYAILLIGGVL